MSGTLVSTRHEETVMYPMVEQERTREVAIRAADDRDVLELMRLADLDSRPVPAGRVLVAEAGGRIRAALSVDRDAMIADPFVATAELQALLRLRAEQMRRERRAGRRSGVLSALHLRPGRA